MNLHGEPRFMRRQLVTSAITALQDAGWAALEVYRISHDTTGVTLAHGMCDAAQDLREMKIVIRVREEQA